jgi:hypothetical protein
MLANFFFDQTGRAAAGLASGLKPETYSSFVPLPLKSAIPGPDLIYNSLKLSSKHLEVSL